MRRALILLGLLVAAIHEPLVAEAVRLQLPTVYEAGHFYATPELANGQSMRLVVDTGGAGGSGLYALGTASAERLGLDITPCNLDNHLIQTIEPPTFQSGKGLPPSAHAPCGAAAIVRKGFAGAVDGEDGLLGAGYLPGHIWTFDYPGRKLWLEPKAWRPPTGARRTSLGFPQNAEGEPMSGFARITLTVDGQPLDLLLDTGATAKPTAIGEQASGTTTQHGIGVTSYITTSVLNRWHRSHPDWRVVANGDDLEGSQHATRLIEVPKVDIAGWMVDKVWFTERADANFSDDGVGMSSYMDKQVAGSAGGNIFNRFIMTIDYPARAAWFTCVDRCKAATVR